jgi:uncharacterized protein involved in type VI secretion and phage assembly
MWRSANLLSVFLCLFASTECDAAHTTLASPTQTPDNALTCWVRVAQQQAGPGMGWQLLPRIGQEVLVTFMDGDIDRPLVVAGSYNGQGEGGIVPTL